MFKDIIKEKPVVKNDLISTARELSFDLTLVDLLYGSSDGGEKIDGDEDHIRLLQHEHIIQNSRISDSILLLDILSNSVSSSSSSSSSRSSSRSSSSSSKKVQEKEEEELRIAISGTL